MYAPKKIDYDDIHPQKPPLTKEEEEQKRQALKSFIRRNYDHELARIAEQNKRAVKETEDTTALLFVPRLSKNSLKILDSINYNSSNLPIYERQKILQIHKKEKAEALKNDVLVEQSKECSFKPKTNAKIGYNPKKVTPELKPSANKKDAKYSDVKLMKDLNSLGDLTASLIKKKNLQIREESVTDLFREPVSPTPKWNSNALALKYRSRSEGNINSTEKKESEGGYEEAHYSRETESFSFRNDSFNEGDSRKPNMQFDEMFDRVLIVTKPSGDN